MNDARYKKRRENINLSGTITSSSGRSVAARANVQVDKLLGIVSGGSSGKGAFVSSDEASYMNTLGVGALRGPAAEVANIAGQKQAAAVAQIASDMYANRPKPKSSGSKNGKNKGNNVT